MRNLICPVSPLRVNENVVRLTALLVALLGLIYILTLSLWIVLLLIVDFYIRGFTNLKVSPVSWLAAQIRQGLQLPEVPTDKAKKIFAARVGFLFTVAMAALYFVHPFSSVVVTLVLMTFALLESLFNICVGCMVYTYFVYPLYHSRA